MRLRPYKHLACGRAGLYPLFLGSPTSHAYLRANENIYRNPLHRNLNIINVKNKTKDFNPFILHDKSVFLLKVTPYIHTSVQSILKDALFQGTNLKGILCSEKTSSATKW